MHQLNAKNSGSRSTQKEGAYPLFYLVFFCEMLRANKVRVWGSTAMNARTVEKEIKKRSGNVQSRREAVVLW